MSSQQDRAEAAQAEPHDKTGEASPLVIWGGAGAIMAAFAVVFVANHVGSSHSKATVPQPPAVTVITIGESELLRDISLAGEARPKDDVRVFARAQGVRILELLVDEGAVVSAGQPLARLDSRLAGAQTQAAQAAVAEARAAATKADDDYKRAEAIRDTGALSAEAFEARRTAALAASARLSAAHAQLAETEARLEGGFVRAPKAGNVIERAAQIGMLADGQMLFRIAGGAALEVGAEIGEADMLSMKPGQTARFDLVDGTSLTGTLRRLPAAIDSRTRTGEAVFDLPRHPRLRAGMYVRGRAELPGQSVMAAPQTALVYDGQQAYVFVLTGDNKVKRTPVKLGARAGDMVAIEGGLGVGERLVSVGAAFLQDGDAITPMEPKPPNETGAFDLRGRG
jgi:HlyD family secretion protein